MKKRTSALLIAFMVGFIAFLPQTQAVSPPPDGGYPGGNTGEGQDALLSLTTGTYNTAVGFFSLRSLLNGSFNTATGAGTLLFNNSSNNTATGAGALLTNTSGFQNTANGAFALFSNSTGSANSATGYGALQNNAGDSNTADGFDTLFSNTSGIANTAIGFQALLNNTTGNGNTALGENAGNGVTTADNVICIGTNVQGADVSNSCFIGNIRDVTTQNADGIAVVIDSAGQLGTMSSSRRFKTEIEPMDKASEAILALKPATFHYKNDKTNAPQFGLIAEDVAKVQPDLVARDKNGEIYSVRYDAVNAMLLNEFLKEHRNVEQLTKDFDSKLAAQEKQIETLTAALQKVNAQLEANKPTTQLVTNNH